MTYQEAKKLLARNYLDVAEEGLIKEWAEAQRVVKKTELEVEKDTFANMPEHVKQAMREAAWKDSPVEDRGYAPDWGDSNKDFEQKKQHKETLNTRHSIR